MDLSTKLRELAALNDEIASHVDEQWKEADREAIALRTPRLDEQQTQKLRALSVMLWQAHHQLVTRGIPAADKLAG